MGSSDGPRQIAAKRGVKCPPSLLFGGRGRTEPRGVCRGHSFNVVYRRDTMSFGLDIRFFSIRRRAE
jgi:hypothetical protein